MKINGINVITQLNDISDLVTIGYVINVGAYDEDETNLGITHLIEHLLFKGTNNMTANEINKYIEKLGGSMNAYTSYTKTKFYCTVPSKYWKEATIFLNDLIFYNTIPEDQFNLEKDVVLNELRMYDDDSDSNCQDNLMRIIFNNAINRQVVGGTVESVSKITRNQVINFINNYYVNNNIDIIVSGNINGSENDFYNFIESITFELSNNFKREKDYFTFDVKDLEVVKYKNDIYQSILNWGLIGPSKDDKDYFPFLIITNLLGGNMSSVLYEEVREKLGLVYTINMNVNDEFKDYSLALGSTSLQKKNIDKVKKIINDNINNVHIDETLLENNKIYLIGSLLRSLQTTNGINDYLTNNKINKEEYINLINMVTIKDIERVIKKYFKNSNIYYSSIISQ